MGWSKKEASNPAIRPLSENGLINPTSGSPGAYNENVVNTESDVRANPPLRQRAPGKNVGGAFSDHQQVLTTAKSVGGTW